jgi:hypothetical protein
MVMWGFSYIIRYFPTVIVTSRSFRPFDSIDQHRIICDSPTKRFLRLQDWTSDYGGDGFCLRRPVAAAGDPRSPNRNCVHSRIDLHHTRFVVGAACATSGDRKNARGLRNDSLGTAPRLSRTRTFERLRLIRGRYAQGTLACAQFRNSCGRGIRQPSR